MPRHKETAIVTLENDSLSISPDTIEASPGVNKIVWKRASSDFDFTGIRLSPSTPFGHAYIHDPYITVLDYDDAELYATYTLYGDASGTPVKSDPKIYNKPTSTQ